MRLLIAVVIIVVLFFPAFLVWSNSLLSFINSMKRYHIGCWKDENEWQNAVEKRALQWTKSTPAVKTSNASNYVVLDILKGEYKNATVQSWQSAELLLGLFEYKAEGSTQVVNEMRNHFIKSDGSWKVNIDKIDYALLAFSLLKSSDNPQKIAPAMKQMIDVLNENLCNDGMISYSQGNKASIRYVDTLDFVCPFLALYGETYGEKKYVQMAVAQIEIFQENGMYMDTLLPCHAYHSEKKVPVGIYGWGRGTSWYFLALIDTWFVLSDCPEKERLYKYIETAAESYIVFQQPDGGFHTILQGGGQYDSSVTAAMAYFYSACYKIFGKPEYKSVSNMALNKLKQVTMKSGAIDCCQGDTHGLGSFSQTFDIMPFAQGLVMRTLANKKEQTNGAA